MFDSKGPIVLHKFLYAAPSGLAGRTSPPSQGCALGFHIPPHQGGAAAARRSRPWRLFRKMPNHRPDGDLGAKISADFS